MGWSSPPGSGLSAEDEPLVTNGEAELRADTSANPEGKPRRRRRRRPRAEEHNDDVDAVEYATGLELPTFVVRDLPEEDSSRDAATATTDVEYSTDCRPEPVRHAVNLDELSLDDDAAKVVRRLTRHGYEAYLVGGCVRDLLLGRHPKDFDVATNAPPDEVRRLFKNSRIIGRRFRLVHVLFGGGKVIETATFRRAPRQDDEGDGTDLLIRSDNEFGRAHEDACRRDFTINGLFYDLERREVLDWVNGMPDIACRTVNTIGAPVVRFLEDPVRMLRAIKFAARLDLGIHPDVYDAIVQCRESLAMAARPRLFEEVWRLLREGAAHRALWLAWEVGVLDVLLPELAAFLADEPASGGLTWRALSVIDQQVRGRKQVPSDVVLWFTLLAEPLLEVCAAKRDRMVAASRFLEPIIDRLNLPRRIADSIRRVAAVLPRLEAGRTGRLNRGALWNDLQQIHQIRRFAVGWPASMHEYPDSDSVLSSSSPRNPRRRSKLRDAEAKLPRSPDDKKKLVLTGTSENQLMSPRATHLHKHSRICSMLTRGTYRRGFCGICWLAESECRGNIV